jgi:hypothetical protein
MVITPDPRYSSIHLATGGYIYLEAQGSSNVEQGVLILRRDQGNSYSDPNRSSIVGLAVEAYSTALTTTQPAIVKSILFTGGAGPSDTTVGTPLTGDGSGNIIVPFSSLLGISSINNMPFPPPSAEVISTFQTASISSLVVSSINGALVGLSTFSTLAASTFGAGTVSTGQVLFSSFNGYGFSTLSQWNVAPAGYDITLSNNQFYVGQSNVFKVIANCNDRFMLIGGNNEYLLPSTMISSILIPGDYTFSEFYSTARYSISTAVAQAATYSDSRIFADINLISNVRQYFGLLTPPITQPYNYAIANGLAFFSTFTGYGTPNVPYAILSNSSKLFGVTYGGTLQNPPIPVPDISTLGNFAAISQTATVLTIPVGGYSADAFVSTLNTQIQSLVYPYNKMSVYAVNQSTNQFSTITSQSINFEIVLASPSNILLGLNFTNSGSRPEWNLSTVSNGVLSGAQAILGIPTTEPTMNNYGGGIDIIGQRVDFTAPAFGSNMQFDTADILGMAVSSINKTSWEEVATQNGIGSNFTLTTANNSFIIGQSNIHNIIADYNNFFGLTAVYNSGGSLVSTQVTCALSTGIYTHEEFVVNVNQQIAYTRARFPDIWTGSLPFTISISSISTTATNFQISDYDVQDGIGITFTRYGQGAVDAGTLAILSTSGLQFGMPTPSTLICNRGTETLQPSPFPDFSRAGSAIIATLSTGTYNFQGLVSTLQATTATFSTPYNTIAFSGLSTLQVNGTVTGGQIQFSNTTTSNQSYIGFGSAPEYPFARGVTGCNFALAASTLGFNTDNGGFLTDSNPVTGTLVTGLPTYFGSNMVFDTAIISSLWVSSINPGISKIKLGDASVECDTGGNVVVSTIGATMNIQSSGIVELTSPSSDIIIKSGDPATSGTQVIISSGPPSAPAVGLFVGVTGLYFNGVRIAGT